MAATNEDTLMDDDPPPNDTNPIIDCLSNTSSDSETTCTTQKTLFDCGLKRFSNMSEAEILESKLASKRSALPTKKVTPRKTISKKKYSRHIKLFSPKDHEPKIRQRPSVYTKWWTPELSSPIIKAMNETRNFTNCLAHLRRCHKTIGNSSPYDKLSRSTMYKWFEKDNLPELTLAGKSYFSKQSSYHYERGRSILKNLELVEELRILVARQRSNGNYFIIYLPALLFIASKFLNCQIFLLFQDLW
jgi:hypothetical protein